MRISSTVSELEGGAASMAALICCGGCGATFAALVAVVFGLGCGATFATLAAVARDSGSDDDDFHAPLQ